MKKETKIGVATAALRKVLKEIGLERFRHDASGSLQMRMSKYMRGPWENYQISEGTINLARRHILMECQKCGHRFERGR